VHWDGAPTTAVQPVQAKLEGLPPQVALTVTDWPTNGAVGLADTVQLGGKGACQFTVRLAGLPGPVALLAVSE
jgi:hypothetical protein